jgi:hypothetical protein
LAALRHQALVLVFRTGVVRPATSDTTRRQSQTVLLPEGAHPCACDGDIRVQPANGGPVAEQGASDSALASSFAALRLRRRNAACPAHTRHTWHPRKHAQGFPDTPTPTAASLDRELSRTGTEAALYCVSCSISQLTRRSLFFAFISAILFFR